MEWGGDVGNRHIVLQSARKRKGLTQKQVADALGITLRSYQHYEYGERTPPLVKAMELARLLDLDIYELAGRNSTPNNESA
nr:helix-turn-helix transcriptional regulator [Alicyclobacillus kakegawensis]